MAATNIESDLLSESPHVSRHVGWKICAARFLHYSIADETVLFSPHPADVLHYPIYVLYAVVQHILVVSVLRH